MDRDGGRWRALLVNGTVGSGKTETAVQCGALLSATGDRVAVVDLDWLRRAPAPAGDPFNLELELANLAAVSANYRARAIRTMVLAGVLEDPAARSRYAQAVSSDLAVVRLLVDPRTVRDRLRRRQSPLEVARLVLSAVGWDQPTT